MTADSLNPSPPTEETFPQSSRQQAPAQPPPRQTLRQQQEEPIYAHLVKAWHLEGRTVPGEPDLEWRRLTKGLRATPLTPRNGRVLPGKHRRDSEGQQK